MKNFIIIMLLSTILSSCSTTQKRDVIAIDANGRKTLNGKVMKSDFVNHITSEEVILQASEVTPYREILAVMRETRRSDIQDVSIVIKK